MPGVPIRDWIEQSELFQICVFGALYAAIDCWHARRSGQALMLVGLGFIFLGNIVYITTGRTTVVVMPFLLVLLGLRRFNWKGVVTVAAVGAVLATILWGSSPYLRMRVEAVGNEIAQYREQDVRTSAGERLEFWRKSLEFIARAPLIGHGTGSIHQLFVEAAGKGSGASSIPSANPHQQIFAVGIQFGLVGIGALLALWVSHLLMFWRPGLEAWCGLIVVTQNIIASLFNSHLFDFVQGWTYVFAVGALGGGVLGLRDSASNPPQSVSGHNLSANGETPIVTVTGER
jgi:hypothetical protein